MLASSEVMDALKTIGLNLYERKLWVALLAKGVATAGELSSVASVPRSRSYDVLQTLADKGFVVVQTSKPLKYVAMSPKEALDKAKEKLREYYELNIERISRLQSSKIINELDLIHKRGLELVLPEDLTGSLKGKYSVFQQTDTMFRDANKNINIVTTPEGLNDLFSNHLDALKKAKERGVDIRIAATGTERCSEAIKSFNSIADVKVVDEKEVPVSGKFMVVDGKQMILSLTNAKVHSTQDMAMWSKSEHAAGEILDPMFKMIWSHSKNC